MGGWASQYIYMYCKTQLAAQFSWKESYPKVFSLAHSSGAKPLPNPPFNKKKEKKKKKNIPHRILLRIRPPLQPPRPKAINIRPRRLSRTEADLIRCQTHHTSITSMQIHHIIDRGTLDKMAHIRNARYGVDFGARDVSQWVVDVGCIDEFGDEVGEGLNFYGGGR